MLLSELWIIAAAHSKCSAICAVSGTSNSIYLGTPSESALCLVLDSDSAQPPILDLMSTLSRQLVFDVSEKSEYVCFIKHYQVIIAVSMRHANYLNKTIMYKRLRAIMHKKLTFVYEKLIVTKYILAQ